MKENTCLFLDIIFFQLMHGMNNIKFTVIIVCTTCFSVHKLCYVMLFYVMLYYVMLSYVMLCYVDSSVVFRMILAINGD